MVTSRTWGAVAVILACVAMPVTHGLAEPTAPQAAGSSITNSGTAKPVEIKPTPEQKAIIDADAAVPCDQPAVKIDANLKNRDGTLNPNFAKPNGRFMGKHQEYLARGKQGPIGVLFLGDSITEGWNQGGKNIWKNYVEKYNAANFGISGDRTQHVLWRIENGELDGISPKLVILMIGTNNIRSSAGEILKGDLKIVEMIHTKLPNARLLVLGIFPRGSDPANPRVKADREKIKTVNEGLAKLDDGGRTRYLDIGGHFLDADGKLPKEIMPDALHPNETGYQIWSTAMEPLMEEMLK
jgi:beta-glucosidase